MSQKNLWNLSIEEVERQFNTSTAEGLTPDEALRRVAEYGRNAFEKKKKRSLFQKFLDQFKSFMILVLLAAAVISGVVGQLSGEGFTDAIIILVIVLLNAVIGTAQEAKAEQSLEALEKLSAPHCKVVRGGQIETIDSADLVPGDVVVLDTGDSVPADLRLTEAVNLKIQESALTGESLPEEKHTAPIEGDAPLGDRENLAFSSCNVTYGRGRGIVVATAMQTEVGKIAAMIQAVPDTKTPMQEKLDRLGKFLGLAALAICALIFLVGILYRHNVLDMFMTAVSLAAAAIPEGLPAVSTIVLAVGVQRLVKKHAIVRTLPSVETLGSTSVICSDKTGTLTQNRMTVVKLYTNGDFIDVTEGASDEPQQETLLSVFILANDAKLSGTPGAWKTTGDPTETALIDAGLRFNLVKNALETRTPRLAEIPFDSERKMMTTVHKRQDSSLLVCTKGGLDEILAGCDRIFSGEEVKPLTDEVREKLRSANQQMAQGALRVLAAALKRIDALPEEITPATLETGLVFVGMAGMIDPPREEVKGAVETCRTAGIQPVMITGDHRITAVAIAEQLGIKEPGQEALTGADVERMSDDELQARVPSVAVYARVAPEHKVRIVRAFQKNGEIVAMTGDGVNDAPALKLADIGVAMGITGTDVSKEASDIVLTDDNFSTIVTAVAEGRRIYDNILKAIQFMLSTNIGEILVLFVAVMANWGSPLLPIHILWINLVTDSLPALALSVDPAAPDVMRRQPIDGRGNIMTRPFSIRIFLQGAMIGGLSLAAFLIGRQTSMEVAQTMTFAVLAFSQIAHVFNARSANHSAFRGMFRNGYLWGAVVIVAAMMLAVLEIPALHDIFRLAPLTTAQWWWIVGLSLAPLPIVELIKMVCRLVAPSRRGI